MDVTNDLGTKLQTAVAALPTELQPLFDGVFAHMAALETQGAADATAAVAQAGSVIQADLVPLLAEVSALRVQVARFADFADRINVLIQIPPMVQTASITPKA